MQRVIVPYAQQINGDVKTCPEGTAFLEGIHSQVYFIGVMGTTRSGKSSLQNWILNGNQFIVGHEGSQTKGIHFSTSVQTVGEVIKNHQIESNFQNKDAKLIFVDTEGSGDEDELHDFTIMLPVLCTSTSILFHLPRTGHVAKNDALMKLAMLTRAASQVSPQLKFGHLNIIIRDAARPVEHLTKELMDNEQGASANERNQIRALLKTHFTSVTIHALPHPGKDIPDSQIGELPVEKFCDAFQSQFKNLVKTIVNQCIGGSFSSPDAKEALRIMEYIIEVYPSENRDSLKSSSWIFKGKLDRVLKNLKLELKDLQIKDAKRFIEFKDTNKTSFFAKFSSQIPEGVEEVQKAEYQKQLKDYIQKLTSKAEVFLQKKKELEDEISRQYCLQVEGSLLSSLEFHMQLVKHLNNYEEPFHQFCNRFLKNIVPDYDDKAYGVHKEEIRKELIHQVIKLVDTVKQLFISKNWKVDETQLSGVLKAIQIL